MRVRFENWVNGLNGDWCVSRQRFFGVPFPLWYPIDKDGVVDYSRPIVPDEVAAADRSVDRRAGRVSRRSARPAEWIRRRSRHHGHVGDLVDDAADRVSGWREDADLFARVFPMDLRPQGHDIIRTWLFSTRAARASRARQPAVVARGDLGIRDRSRPQEDVEVERQRRHAVCAARGARLRRRALLGGEGRARASTRCSMRRR